MKTIPLSNPDLFLIAGPCVVENEALCHTVAAEALKCCTDAGIPFIFKASYRKANRSKVTSFTGIGDKEALEIIARIGKTFNVSTVTDIHNPEEAELAAQYVDILQIPAFLCRQTDLLVAAARTGKTVNIKKGQFMSAHAMQFAVEKIKNEGNQGVMLTERGNMFGYGDLIVDFRNIPLMKALGVPVILDVTHSLQVPNHQSGVTGGQPQMIETMTLAGVAAGANGIFIETHPDPSKALSDGANMLSLHLLKPLVNKMTRLNASLLKNDE